jgi:hypothetical protein
MASLNPAQTPPASASPWPVGWAAAPATTGVVTTAGDVAIIDATTAHLPAGAKGVAVTMYVSNLAGFAKNYTAFALPVGIYKWNTTSWLQSELADFYSGGKNALFINDSDGSVTLNLPAGTYYEIVIDKNVGFWQSAGSFVSPSPSSSAIPDLGPSFYLTSTVY